ncbi:MULTISPECIES: hypothetical protein [unclassified Agarivorans]|uniref:hypothetical protein n=1 Tax=unclassified Agarivorans TaxID=2636026 RepID=UPI0026E267B9|nr:MULTISPECIES: hypothetical protein [unclassified Agarivorans]MDO6687505.1 hypothetical protein [Agarivorans sp. 3_MG-2023]MDO6717162.1 hypothetical protein [Agarivorans sp. 2_MG-2023]
MEFEYKNLNGEVSEAAFSELVVVAEGPIKLDSGWQSDRVNYLKSLSIYIEFQSGPENPPGVVPSRAIEVTKEYVKQSYGISL